MGSLQPVIIDDGDLHDILYQPTNLWAHRQGQNFHGSTFSAGFTGAQSQFTFNGTNLVVYGAQTPRPAGNKTAVPPSVTFAIDGVIPMVVVSNPDVNSTQYATQFFDSHTLPAGEHVLQIDVQYGSDDWPFVIDYLEYTPMNSSSTSVSSGSGSQTSHTGPIIGGFVGGAALVGGVALASWLFYKRKRRPGRMAKKYGHYVLKDAKKRPDLADSFEDYKPTCEDIIVPPTSSYIVQETRSLHSGSVRTETVMYLPRRASMESLSEMEFAQLSAQFPLPRPNSHVLYHQPSYSSFAPSRPGTPSSASPSVYGHQLPLLPPAPYCPGSPTISYRSATTADLSTISYSTTNSRAPLQLATGSHYGGESPSRHSKQVEAEARPRHKPATFHADSGARFTTYGEMILASEPDTVPPETPPTFLQTDPAELGRSEDELEERRRRKARHVSLCGTAISDVPPMYTEQ
ncbi:hypothetical protein LXA43DRAFT_64981 [Ganoderma leucocontextum]|nr:hypothetical protein LXA43DRAFT_64981 [Ganoderma leucocontextum]